MVFLLGESHGGPLAFSAQKGPLPRLIQLGSCVAAPCKTPRARPWRGRYPPGNIEKAMENGPFIVDLPINRGYVSLPEGRYTMIHNGRLGRWNPKKWQECFFFRIENVVHMMSCAILAVKFSATVDVFGTNQMHGMVLCVKGSKFIFCCRVVP